MEELFRVVEWFPDGSYLVGQYLPAKEAVERAAMCTRKPAATIGMITKVTIVAAQDDATVFQWEHGRGVTFPPQEQQQ